MGVAILKDKDSKSQENNILSNDSVEVKGIVSFLGNLASKLIAKPDPNEILCFFASDAFGASESSDTFIVNEKSVENFIKFNPLCSNSISSPSIENFIAKKIAEGLFEIAFQLKTSEGEKEYLQNFALTAESYEDTYKILSVYFADASFSNDKKNDLTALFDELTEQLPLSILKIKKSNKLEVLFANGAFISLLGEDTIKKLEKDNSFLTFINPQDKTFVQQEFYNAIEKNTDLSVKIDVETIDYGIKNLHLFSSYEKTEKEDFLIVAIYDITALTRELTSIKNASETILAGNAKESSFPFEFFPSRNLITFSPDTVAKFGFPNVLDNVYGELQTLNIISPEYIDTFFKLLYHISMGESDCSALIKITSLGEELFVNVRLKAIYNEHGVIVKAMGVFILANVQKDLDLLFKANKISKTMLLKNGESLNVFYIQSGNIEKSSYKGHEKEINDIMSKTPNYYAEVPVYANAFLQEKDRANFVKLLSKDNLLRLYEEGSLDFHFEHMEKPIGFDKFIYMDVIVHIEKANYTPDVQAYVYIKNIDKEKTLENYFRFKAEHDELTGLYNRATFVPLATNAIKQGGGNQLHALCSIDINNFVNVNDSFGQDYGDNLLIELSKKLKSIFDESCILARTAGHRFVVFMRDIPSKEFATARCNLLKDYFIASHQQETGTTLSIGIAYNPFDAKNFLDLLQCSEKALGEAGEMDKATSNLLKYEDITKTKYENDVRKKAELSANKDVFEISNKKKNSGAYQYFVDRNVKYWMITVIIAICLVAVVVALELTFSNLLSNFVMQNDNAFWFVIGCSTIVLIAIAILYATSNKKINSLLYVDKITLGNTRMLFEEAVDTYTMKHNVNYAFVICDILDFRVVNERFGNKTGELALKKLSAIITNCLGDKEIAGRLYDDKFGILIRFEKDKTEVFDKVERIERLARRITDDKNLVLDIITKFGIYFIDASLKEDLAQYETHAELALSKANENQQLIYYVFDDRSKNLLIREKELEGMMQDSLFNNNFIVYIQPKVSTMNGRVVGGEALVRWLHEGEFIMPGEFIDLFEKNGFITKLDEYIFTEICKTLRRWQDEGRRLVVVSVNISKKSFQQPNFVRTYKRIMDKYRVDKRFVEFEITESMMVDDFEHFTAIIGKIHGMGCTCSVDDFGTGFSSLSLLKTASVDALKIDRSFFLVGPSQEEMLRAKAVIKGIVDIAKSLNMIVVAEGVELPSLIQFLRDIYCDEIQSFAFYRPLPIDDFQKLLG